jgi:hypothetical protein
MARRHEIVRVGHFNGSAPAEELADRRYNFAQDQMSVFEMLRRHVAALGLDVEREIRELEARAERAIVALR